LVSNSRVSWTVHKFGGTSLATSDRYRAAADIVTKKNAISSTSRGPTAIVVSAMSKVTDALIELTTLAAKRDETYLVKLDALLLKHSETATSLLSNGAATELCRIFRNDFESLKEILRGVWHVQSASESVVEFISGHGEIWSAQLLNAHLLDLGETCRWLDARKALVVERGETAVVVNWANSQSKLQSFLQEAPSAFVVITGFIASTAEGTPTTLKRNGSDYSAAIFGKLLQASEILIWTDVDGVLSADPRLVPEAVVLLDLSYREMVELAYFGAKVVHPSTMAPAIQDEIPIWIKNTFKPEKPGTKIHTRSFSKAPVKGFATIENVSVLNLEGTGMMGVPGVAQRLFGALKDVGISVIMISQASSEHSICFAVPGHQAEQANKAATQAFLSEIQNGLIQNVTCENSCSILAAVGDNMVNQPGIAGRFLSALGQAGVNIRAIAQGASERNISVVIAGTDSTRALRAVHASFFLSHHTLSIGILGAGGIGGTLLEQLQLKTSELNERFKIDLRVRGVSNSKLMCLSDQAIELTKWKAQLASATTKFEIDKFENHILAPHIPHAVIVDCTASEDIADRYAHWLKRGIHVITPNKKAGSGPLNRYEELQAVLESSRGRLYFETTVGAGLPIINTLRELVRTGDEVHSIEGILSGTLSFIFNSFSESKPFSTVVLEAKAKGYTEPDPRDDLSGIDFARKLVILARESGVALELKDVAIEPLLSDELQNVSVDEFITKLPSIDAKMSALASEAKANGEKLRYVGRIVRNGDGSGSATISLKRYPSSHPFAQTQSTDNIVAFSTRRYANQPLVVQGPGAGPDVTAAGVFADLLRLCSHLGASL
jgi:aspartokinase/homoserine dehydrogenase 1